jgi:hypothetical protein
MDNNIESFPKLNQLDSHIVELNAEGIPKLNQLAPQDSDTSGLTSQQVLVIAEADLKKLCPPSKASLTEEFLSRSLSFSLKDHRSFIMPLVQAPNASNFTLPSVLATFTADFMASIRLPLARMGFSTEIFQLKMGPPLATLALRPAGSTWQQCVRRDAGASASAVALPASCDAFLLWLSLHLAEQLQALVDSFPYYFPSAPPAAAPTPPAPQASQAAQATTDRLAKELKDEIFCSATQKQKNTIILPMLLSELCTYGASAEVIYAAVSSLCLKLPALVPYLPKNFFELTPEDRGEKAAFVKMLGESAMAESRRSNSLGDIFAVATWCLSYKVSPVAKAEFLRGFIDFAFEHVTKEEWCLQFLAVLCIRPLDGAMDQHRDLWKAMSKEVADSERGKFFAAGSKPNTWSSTFKVGAVSTHGSHRRHPGGTDMGLAKLDGLGVDKKAGAPAAASQGSNAALAHCNVQLVGEDGGSIPGELDDGRVYAQLWVQTEARGSPGYALTVALDSQSTVGFVLEGTLASCPDMLRERWPTQCRVSTVSGVQLYDVVVVRLSTQAGKSADIPVCVLPSASSAMSAPLLLGPKQMALLGWRFDVRDEAAPLGPAPAAAAWTWESNSGAVSEEDAPPRGPRVSDQYSEAERRLPEETVRVIERLASLDASSFIVSDGSGERPEFAMDLVEGAPPHKDLCCFRLLPAESQQIVDEAADELVSNGLASYVSHRPAKGVIAPSLVVWKKNGDPRVCTDTRELNKYLKPVPQVIPDQQSIMDFVEGKKVMSQFDMSAAYNQLCISPDSDVQVLFNTSKGLVRMDRGVFGVSTLPGFFCRMMGCALAGLRGVRVFFDDIVVASESLQQHKQDVHALLERLWECKIRINVDKTFLFYKRIQILGFVHSGTHVSPDPAKITGILGTPLPSSRKQLQAFLGMVNFLRGFLPFVSDVAAPLYTMTSGPPRLKWSEEQDAAFSSVLRLVAEHILLFTPEAGEPLVMYTDASLHAIGGALGVIRDGVFHPWRLFSTTLKGGQVNWSATRRELYAVFRSVMEFRDYIVMREVTVFTDHQALAGTLSTEGASRVVAGWLQALADFSLTIKYVPGVFNVFADFLSRYLGTASAETVQRGKDRAAALAEELTMGFMTQVEVCNAARGVMLEAAAAADAADDEDEDGEPARLPEPGRAPAAASFRDSPDLDNLLRADDGGMLQRMPWELIERPDVVDVVKGEEFVQQLSTFVQPGPDGVDADVVIIPPGEPLPDGVEWPEETVAAWLLLGHLDGGHGGIHALTARLRSWGRLPPGSTEAIKDFVKGCTICNRFKIGKQHHNARVSVFADAPTGHLQLDLAQMTPSQGYSYMLVIHDVFSFYVDAVPLANKEARTVAAVLWNWFCRFGWPRKLSSDQGREYVNRVLLELVTHIGVVYKCSAPYHPEAQGRVERSIGSLKSKLVALVQESGESWVQVLPAALSALNRVGRSSVGGITPFELFFARPGTAPFFAGLNTLSDADAPDTTTARMRDWLAYSQGVVSEFRSHICERLQAHREKEKEQFDADHTLSELNCGDVVYRKNVLRLSKADPVFFGPYVVRDVDDRHNYYLRTPRGVAIRTAVPRMHLKLASPRTDTTMFVSAVVEHSAVPDMEKTFKISFTGYGADAREWHKESELLHLRAYQEYVANGFAPVPAEAGDDLLDPETLMLDEAGREAALELRRRTLDSQEEAPVADVEPGEPGVGSLDLHGEVALSQPAAAPVSVPVAAGPVSPAAQQPQPAPSLPTNLADLCDLLNLQSEVAQQSAAAAPAVVPEVRDGPARGRGRGRGRGSARSAGRGAARSSGGNPLHRDKAILRRRQRELEELE